MFKEKYARWMYDWETRLTTRDENRVVRPLEWGFEWIEPFLESHGFSAAIPTPEAMRDEAAWNALDWARAQAHAGAGRAYLYYFVREPPITPGQPNWRATHGAEIPYAFHNPGPAWTEADRALADTMSSSWTNFAKTGDPNGPGLHAWPAFQSSGRDQVMILGPKIEAGEILDSRRVALFDFVAIRRSASPAYSSPR